MNESPMKILMIAPQPFYADRGTPMNTRLMCKTLGEAGHFVDLLVFPTGRKIVLKNVRIVKIPNILRIDSIPIGPSRIKMLYDVILTMAALILCVKKRYDAVHGIEEGGFLAVILGRVFRIPSVFDMDSCISDQLRYSRFIRSERLLNAVASLERLVLRKCTLVITVCAALTEKAASMRCTAAIAQIEDVPLFEDKESAVTNVTAADLRAQLNLKGGKSRFTPATWRRIRVSICCLRPGGFSIHPEGMILFRNWSLSGGLLKKSITIGR